MRWTQEEHEKFVDGMKLHAQDKKGCELYRTIAETIPGRDVGQVQNYARSGKLRREKRERESACADRQAFPQYFEPFGGAS
jgi:hypothetical protein